MWSAPLSNLASKLTADAMCVRAYCVFTMPLLDALVSIGGVAGYFVHTGDVDLPPQVELKLRILSAQLEQRTGYKLL